MGRKRIHPLRSVLCRVCGRQAGAYGTAKSGRTCTDCYRAGRKNDQAPGIFTWPWSGALDRLKAHRLWTRYRLSWGRYQMLLVSQFHACAACGEPFGSRGPIVDHDHACCPGIQSCGLCVRALLCHACNVAEGMLGSPAKVRRLLAYMGG
jgi:hypothetical protein